MKQYVLTVWQPDGEPPASIDFEKMGRELGMLHDEMRSAGAWVFTGALHPADHATVVKVVDGQQLMTDGPYIEGKEHVGGFTIVAADDLDGALGWANKTAAIIGLPIEVRAFRDAPGT